MFFWTLLQSISNAMAFRSLCKVQWREGRQSKEIIMAGETTTRQSFFSLLLLLLLNLRMSLVSSYGEIEIDKVKSTVKIWFESNLNNLFSVHSTLDTESNSHWELENIKMIQLFVLVSSFWLLFSLFRLIVPFRRKFSWELRVKHLNMSWREANEKDERWKISFPLLTWIFEKFPSRKKFNSTMKKKVKESSILIKVELRGKEFVVSV